MRRLNIEVLQTSRRMINLRWSFESMPFAWPGVQFLGDPIALFLRQASASRSARDREVPFIC